MILGRNFRPFLRRPLKRFFEMDQGTPQKNHEAIPLKKKVLIIRVMK
jgi:hypothetical protein